MLYIGRTTQLEKKNIEVRVCSSEEEREQRRAKFFRAEEQSCVKDRKGQQLHEPEKVYITDKYAPLCPNVVKQSSTQHPHPYSRFTTLLSDKLCLLLSQILWGLGAGNDFS